MKRESHAARSALEAEPHGDAAVARQHRQPNRVELQRAGGYELGLKGSACDDRLRYEVAAFYIDYSDRLFQINEVVPFVGFVATTTNIGDSRNFGFEFSTMARLTRDLTLSLGLG